MGRLSFLLLAVPPTLMLPSCGLKSSDGDILPVQVDKSARSNAVLIASSPAATNVQNGQAASATVVSSSYPQRATVSVVSVDYPTGASFVDIPVRLDRATPNTVIARVKTQNCCGTQSAYSPTFYKHVDQTVIFRPGDPLVRTVRVPIARTKNGGQFKLVFPVTPQGAVRGQAEATVTSRTGASVPPLWTSGFRAARTFAATGTLTYDLKADSVRWSDGGSPSEWSTSLAHGRTQPENGETGLYLDAGLHPDAEAPVRVENSRLVLHSQRLAKPIKHDGADWRYGASVLTGLRMPETHVSRGQYEWIARVGDRPGSWPALWLVGVNGWPPEIDVYEGFGYQSSWDFNTDISANLHGGPRGKRAFDRLMHTNGVRSYNLLPIARADHRFAVDIQEDFITWFVDGLEVYQARNPFDEAFYPIMNVAVKTNGRYDDGSGDLEVSGFRVWRIR